MSLTEKIKVYRKKWEGKFLPFFLGAFVLLLIQMSIHGFDRFSRTEAFCTSCHSMDLMGKEYRESIHYSSRSGVRASCGDCHVSKGTLAAMWEHFMAASMVYSEALHDFSDPVATEKARPQMAFKARKWFRERGSATCRNCHVLDAILGSRRGIGAVHIDDAMKKDGNCIECHMNLVHRFVPGEKVFKKAAWDRMVDEEYGRVKPEEEKKEPAKVPAEAPKEGPPAEEPTQQEEEMPVEEALPVEETTRQEGESTDSSSAGTEE
ncbi:MAG: NapC/NirT family cytochrome c [Deltaproteobacteria bacterium]|nr:NapC/NirT family cytochrome c [Deltaproteobacteria bacterium]